MKQLSASWPNNSTSNGQQMGNSPNFFNKDYYKNASLFKFSISGVSQGPNNILWTNFYSIICITLTSHFSLLSTRGRSISPKGSTDVIKTFYESHVTVIKCPEKLDD